MADIIPFTIDLTAHEGARLAAVLEAFGWNWDPTSVFNGEAEAHRLLYSDLDPNQQATYDVLIATGVLPDSPER
jgi:hypothetical protein